MVSPTPSWSAEKVKDAKVSPARAAWDHLDTTVQGLTDDAGLDGPWAELQALLRTPCFSWARYALGDRKPDTAAALRQWWKDAGGSWLTDTAMPAKGRRFWLPPEFRPSLFLDGHERDAAAPILCAIFDAGCGAETRGWLMRAQEAYDQHDRDDEPPLFGGVDRSWRAKKASCAVQANAAPPALRFDKWHDCLTKERPRVARLPVGRFRAPKRGWLVIAGRRGHYGFCDAMSAFDLRTGAAAVVRSCGGLKLGDGGLVDSKATGATRRAENAAGVVSTANLSELMVSLLLLRHAQRLAVDREEVQLPPGLVVPADAVAASVLAADEGWQTSAQTTLEWRWIDEARKLASGHLTWPSSFRAEESHADRLLEVLEAGLAPGCPPATLPAHAADGKIGQTPSIDATTAEQDRTFAALRQVLEKAAAGCAGAR